MLLWTVAHHNICSGEDDEECFFGIMAAHCLGHKDIMLLYLLTLLPLFCSYISYTIVKRMNLLEYYVRNVSFLIIS